MSRTQTLIGLDNRVSLEQFLLVDVTQSIFALEKYFRLFINRLACTMASLAYEKFII